MSNKVIDSTFFTEFEALCSRYGVSMLHGIDDDDQIVIYTGLKLTNDGENYEVIEIENLDDSDDAFI